MIIAFQRAGIQGFVSLSLVCFSAVGQAPSGSTGTTGFRHEPNIIGTQQTVGRSLRFGYMPQGQATAVTGGTGTTGFLHEPYIVGTQQSTSRSLRFGFRSLGNDGGGGPSLPPTGTTGFIHEPWIVGTQQSTSRSLRFGYRPAGALANPGPSPTGTTGFRHEPWIVGTQQSTSRSLRFGYAIAGTGGESVIVPPSCTPAFQSNAFQFNAFQTCDTEQVPPTSHGHENDGIDVANPGGGKKKHRDRTGDDELTEADLQYMFRKIAELKKAKSESAKVAAAKRVEVALARTARDDDAAQIISTGLGSDISQSLRDVQMLSSVARALKEMLKERQPQDDEDEAEAMLLLL